MIKKLLRKIKKRRIERIFDHTEQQLIQVEEDSKRDDLLVSRLLQSNTNLLNIN